MSYAIYIERDEPISLEEWSAAVAARADVRPASEPLMAVNPKTGAKISIVRGPADADVLIDGAWVPCFAWSCRGSISFRAPRDFAQPESVVRTVASALAKALGARLVGEADEEY